MASPPDRGVGDDRDEGKDSTAPGPPAPAPGPPTADTLCDAVRGGNEAEVEECLRHVPVNAKDSTTFTAVRLACLYGWAGCLRVLLKAGANVHQRDSGGAVVLHKAARAGHAECVQLLLDHKASANKQTHGFRDTPLMQAATQGHLVVVKLLLDADAEPQVTDVHGRTARDLAKHAGRNDVAKLIPKPSREDKGRAAPSVASTTTCSTCVTPSEKRA